MRIVSQALILVVALAHVWFLVLEMFLWNDPIGQKTFGMTPECSAASAVLAANQGLYNGFLVVGLVWAVISDRRNLKFFFLGCVLVAGVFGAITAKITILFVQALSAAIALLAVFFAPASRAR
jgi:putative membrane protein